jgi:hypothetical protein
MGSWTAISEICGVFLLAGIVKGGVGFGLPTVAIGLLGLMMAPAQAAALLVAWQALHHRRLPLALRGAGRLPVPYRLLPGRRR